MGVPMTRPAQHAASGAGLEQDADAVLAAEEQTVDVIVGHKLYNIVPVMKSGSGMTAIDSVCRVLFFLTGDGTAGLRARWLFVWGSVVGWAFGINHHRGTSAQDCCNRQP